MAVFYKRETRVNSNAIRTSSPQEALALWLAQNQPHVFQALMQHSRQRAQLSGVTDWLSSVGTSLGGAVKSVGSFLTSQEGIATLGALGTTYLTTRAQRDALRVQVAQAQAGYPPQPVYTVGTDQTPYYRDPATGQSYPLTSQIANQLQPAMNWTPLLIGGGVLFTILLLMRS